eukprot:scaffold10489_cov67-Cylindrotheca_fusiformis.AAC.4
MIEEVFVPTEPALSTTAQMPRNLCRCHAIFHFQILRNSVKLFCPPVSFFMATSASVTGAWTALRLT